jgi:alpha-L-rhamnosidase
MKFKTKKNNTFIVVALFFLSLTINAQPVPNYLTGREINCNVKGNLKVSYLKEAKTLIPTLSHQTIYPVRAIKIENDLQVWLGWKVVTISSARELARITLVKGDTLILDFGRNMVGYLNGITSSQAKIKIEPAEVIAELGDSWEKFPASFDNGYKPTRTWSPKVLDIQNNWRCSERLTFRYIRLVILEANDEIVLSKLNCDEVSAVPFSKIKPLEGFTPKMQQIDLVAQYTLYNCIQEVFEDGPKRDKRLWLGDLRLQAMLDQLTFKSDSIVKRCILLFAGTQRDDGFIASCVYNTSNGQNPFIGDEMIPDYAMLFGSTLLNYSKSSNDLKLATTLYPVACQQVDLVCSKWLNTDNFVEIPNNIWMLIDWSKELDRQAAEQATLIFAINTLSELANMIGLPKDATKWDELNKKLKVAALEKYFDKQKGLFVSGPQHQVSWATQIWMVLAGVVDKNEGARILKNVAADPSAIKPGCPYLVHHQVEAYLVCGMDTAAFQLIDTYWGGMIDKGATTFWEIYDPENPYKSPYNSHLFNSYCHAWSCTPAWFLRHTVYGKRLKAIDVELKNNKIRKMNNLK